MQSAPLPTVAFLLAYYLRAYRLVKAYFPAFLVNTAETIAATVGLTQLASAMAHPPKRLGILAAMPQEVAKLKANVTDQVEHKRGSVFEFVTGRLEGREVVFGAANVRTHAFRIFLRHASARARIAAPTRRRVPSPHRLAWSSPAAQSRR